MAKKTKPVQRYQGGGKVQGKSSGMASTPGSNLDISKFSDDQLKSFIQGAGWDAPSSDRMAQIRKNPSLLNLYTVGGTPGYSTNTGQTSMSGQPIGTGGTGLPTITGGTPLGQVLQQAQMTNTLYPQQQQAAQQQQQQPQQQQQQTPTVQVTPLQATPQTFAAQPGQTMNVPQGSATAAQPLFSLGQQGSQLPQAQNPLLQNQQQPQQYQAGGHVRSRDQFSYQPPQGVGLPSMTPPAGGPQPQPFAGTLPTPPQYPGLIYDPTTPPQPIQNQQFFYTPPTGAGLPSMTPPAGGPQLQPFAGNLPPPPPVQRFQGGGEALPSGMGVKDPKTGVVTYIDPAFSSQLGLGNMTANQATALGVDPYVYNKGQTESQVAAQYQPYFLGAAALNRPAVINLPPSSSMNNPKGGVQTTPGGTIVGTSTPQVPQGPWLTNPSVFAKAAMPTVDYSKAAGWSGGQAGPLTAAGPANAAQMPQYNIQQASAQLPPGSNPVMAQGPNTDRVPASLTPGEFVMNQQATQMFLPQLAAMNQYGAQGMPPQAPGRQVNYVPQGFTGQGQAAQGQAAQGARTALATGPSAAFAQGFQHGYSGQPLKPTAVAGGATKQAQGGGLMMQGGGYVPTPQASEEQLAQGYRNYLANTLAGRTQGYTGAEIVGDIGGPAPPQEQRQPQQQRMQGGGYVGWQGAPIPSSVLNTYTDPDPDAPYRAAMRQQMAQQQQPRQIAQSQPGQQQQPQSDFYRRFPQASQQQQPAQQQPMPVQQPQTAAARGPVMPMGALGTGAYSSGGATVGDWMAGRSSPATVGGFMAGTAQNPGAGTTMSLGKAPAGGIGGGIQAAGSAIGQGLQQAASAIASSVGSWQMQQSAIPQPPSSQAYTPQYSFQQERT